MDASRLAHRARMRKLAEQPHTDVLEYAYDSPAREADAVMCVKMAQRAVEARRALGKLKVDEAARRVCAADPLLKTFSQTHPQTFLVMMDLDNCGRALEMLSRLARLRKSVEEGMPEAEANVHANRIIMENTMRNPTEEEREKLVFPDAAACEAGAASEPRSELCPVQTCAADEAPRETAA